MKAIQLQVSVVLDEEAMGTVVELLRQALTKASTPDEARVARVEASQHAMFGGQKPPEDQELLIDSRQAAKLLKVSPRTLFRMQKDGSMPPPIRLGSAVRWSHEGLKRWVEAGCPSAASTAAVFREGVTGRNPGA